MIFKRSMLNHLAFQDMGGMDFGGGGGGLFDFFSGGSGFAQAPYTQPSDGGGGGGGLGGLFDLPLPGGGAQTGGDSLAPASSNLGGGSGGLFGGMDFTKLLPALISGGTGLIGMLTGQGGATDKALSAQTKATQPLQAAGNQALSAYTTGTLLPYQQQEKQQIMNAVRAKMNQYYASAGIPVSSSQANIESAVQQAGADYDQKVYQQNFDNAVKATGMATTNLTNLATQQAKQDEQQRNEWAAFLKELSGLGGDLFGSSGILSAGGGGDSGTSGGLGGDIFGGAA